MIIDIYAEKKKKEVMEDTWGHLAPIPNKKYPGRIIFCCTDYGENVLISHLFEELSDSPWFYEDISYFVYSQNLEEGKIYLFDGWYKKFKNENCRFSGKTKVLDLSKGDLK